MSPFRVGYAGTADDRFLGKCGAPDENGCVPWLGWRNEKGYGRFFAEAQRNVRKKVYAHRFAWERVNGPIPDGMVIDHLCRTPACVNPSHLEVVTMGENTRRGNLHAVLRAMAESRTHCIHGHEYTLENTYRNANGTRCCRDCGRIKQQRYIDRQKLAGAA